jgi:hypothetical protein
MDLNNETLRLIPVLQDEARATPRTMRHPTVTWNPVMQYKKKGKKR